MATWAEVAGYLRDTYEVSERERAMIGLDFRLSGGRSHLIMVGHAQDAEASGDWVTIMSPIGSVGEVDLVVAATAIRHFVCGGIVIDGEFVFVRHAAPLAEIDVNELEEPMRVVLSAADEIEHLTTGRDRL